MVLINSFPSGNNSEGGGIPDGGTTGQALIKHSNTDGDVEWGTVSTDTSKLYSTDDSAFTGIVDGDYIPVYDTSASTKKKSLWSNIKSLLKTYFDTLYQGKLTAGTNIGINGNTISATNTISLNFSTTEQSVGKWIDGKTVYQKTFQTTCPSADSSLSIGVNVDTCCNISVAVKGTNEWRVGSYYIADNANANGYTISVRPNTASSNQNKIGIFKLGNGYYTGNNMYITIQYTKA